ncbi:hypothetical protein Vadar_007541 [Vaccinium darrowii]|uniref:Uncharacterized protein n=1 Tax=Vaccinium darrowii TaxID=229202 RepID=A0ACB7XXH2_9ERIC|nr:hypothetical protein Vadar_007541 [Vaccinium darrowii]
MSKKMKGVALDSSVYGQFDVSKAKFKHRTPIQDYQELHEEVDAMKNKLETMKLRKLTLLAEVRLTFLLACSSCIYFGPSYRDCTGPTNPGVPQPCTGQSVVVKVVDYCPPGCAATIDLSQEAFSVIANRDAGKINIEFNQ